MDYVTLKGRKIMRQERRTKSVLKQYAEQRKLMYSIVLACAIILMCCYLGYCFGRDCAIRDNAKESSATMERQ